MVVRNHEADLSEPDTQDIEGAGVARAEAPDLVAVEVGRRVAQDVVSAAENAVAEMEVDRVRTGAAYHGVVAGAGDDGVVTGAGIEEVVEVVADDLVVAAAGDEGGDFGVRVAVIEQRVVDVALRLELRGPFRGKGVEVGELGIGG